MTNANITMAGIMSLLPGASGDFFASSVADGLDTNYIYYLPGGYTIQYGRRSGVSSNQMIYAKPYATNPVTFAQKIEPWVTSQPPLIQTQDTSYVIIDPDWMSVPKSAFYWLSFGK